MLAEALKKEILTARALDYRRNTIAIVTVLSALYLLPNIDFKELSFFGIRPSANMLDPKQLVLNCAWALLIYHLIFFIYYAWRDFRVWWSEAIAQPSSLPAARPFFPELRMFFRLAPKRDENIHQTNGQPAKDWRRENNGSQYSWKPSLPGADSHRIPISYSLPYSSVRRFREKFLISFIAIDLGIPLLGVLVPLAALACVVL